MSIEGDLRTALLAMNAVTALVGTGDSARIRPYKLEESDDPEEEHIIIEVDDEDHLNALDAKGGRIMATVNISCRAMTIAEARALAEAVRMNGTSPGTGLGPYGGSGAAFDSWLDSEAVSVLSFDDGSDRAWYTVEQSYTVTATETT